MEVVTFLRDEMKESIAEPDGWLEKVKELGLEGQEELVGDGQKSPVPFLRLTKEHKAILEIICPDVVDVKKYSKAPIPLQALAMLGLATAERYFQKVEVWHSEGNPDPVMVGDGEFLMAQWGPERVTYEEQKRRASEIWIASAKLRLQEAYNELKADMENVEALFQKHLSGGWLRYI